MAMTIARIFLAICLTTPTAVGQISASEEQVRDAIERFLSAFEVGDLSTMEAAFAENATTFPPVTMANNREAEIDASAYQRVRGFPPQITELVAAFRAKGRETPYMLLVPDDLEIRVYGDVALVTFHLVNGQRLGRRTIILNGIDKDWRIIHLHASSVSGMQ